MGMTGALKLKRVVANTRNVLAIEALAAAQALDILAPLKPSKRAQQALKAIRDVAKMMEHDRSLAPDMARVAQVISRGEIAKALR
jgi:histidine ammonia-lyase